MGSGGERDAIWTTLDQPWDLLVIGGGVTGAAILREATRAGQRALLVEQRDFAWGTSSRSSKLVHGGLRYLNQGQLQVVRDSVRQRQHLLREGPGLITPVGFTFAHYQRDRPGLWLYQLGIALYDILAGQWNHQRYDPQSYSMLAPHVTRHELVGALRCVEATTDDARLVFRLVAEARAAGGAALNYVKATTLLREGDVVVGARVYDLVGQREAEVRAHTVINATGVWVDQLRGQLNAVPRMRPLRGSHLLFPAWRFPVAQVVAFQHPLDRRYVCVVPWEDVTLVGTTDLDHRLPLDDEPAISPDEVTYLMAGVAAVFPTLALTLDDVIATFSGVRPVIDSGKSDPSKESRDHLVLDEQGLVTVTGGKLTTFRQIAHDALAVAHTRFPLSGGLKDTEASFAPVADDLTPALPQATRLRLLGRYGAAAAPLVAAAQAGELEPIAGTSTLWAELRWAARNESVIHLDDLLLRRVRLGLLVPDGGAALLPQIRTICQPELGWDDARWLAEETAYLAHWAKHYCLPDHALIADWQALLTQADAKRQVHVAQRRKRARRRRMIAVLLGAGAGLAAVLLGQRSARSQ